MFPRRSLRWPITLGVVLIVLVVTLTVGWVLLNVTGALTATGSPGLYWTLLSVGSVLFATLLGGVIAYLVISIRAITLNRRQSNFIDAVTHELKSPIASLKLYLQTLNRRTLSAEQKEDFYRFMLEDVERLDDLINHLLDAARLQRPASADDVEEIALDELLREAAAAVCLRYQLPSETVTLKLEPCTLPARRGDLEVIFRNLLDNAVKYTDENPQVSVSLWLAAGGQAVIRVADNGRGIPAAQRRKIFGRFVRLGSELERDKPGTGLGLHLVRTTVHRLRGRIRIRDPESGVGTVFEVLLPGARSAPKESAPQQRDPAPLSS